MHRFSDTDEVLSSLNRLQEFPGGELVTELPRQAGQKEARFAHLLSGEPDIPAAVEEVSPRAGGSGLEARVAALENEVREMRELLARMRTELGID